MPIKSTSKDLIFIWTVVPVNQFLWTVENKT